MCPSGDCAGIRNSSKGGFKKNKSHPSVGRAQIPLFTGRGTAEGAPAQPARGKGRIAVCRLVWDTAPFHAARTAQGQARAEAASRARRLGPALEPHRDPAWPGRRTLRPHRPYPRPPGLPAPGPRGPRQRRRPQLTSAGPRAALGGSAPPRPRPRSAPAPPAARPGCPAVLTACGNAESAPVTTEITTAARPRNEHVPSRTEHVPSRTEQHRARTEQTRALLFSALCPKRLPDTCVWRG